MGGAFQEWVVAILSKSSLTGKHKVKSCKFGNYAFGLWGIDLLVIIAVLFVLLRECGGNHTPG